MEKDLLEIAKSARVMAKGGPFVQYTGDPLSMALQAVEIMRRELAHISERCEALAGQSAGFERKPIINEVV